MLRIFLHITFFLFFIGQVEASMIIRGSGGGSACLGNEDVGFEEIGAPAKWTGTADFDYSADPLECTESMQIAPAEAAVWGPNWASTVRYWTMWITLDDGIEAIESFINVQDSAGATIGAVKLRGTEAFFVLAGTNSSDTSETIIPNSTTKIKFMADTSAAASIITLWVWNGSGWGTPITSTDGTNVNDIDKLQFLNGADTENIIVDYIKTSTSDIMSPD